MLQFEGLRGREPMVRFCVGSEGLSSRSTEGRRSMDQLSSQTESGFKHPCLFVLFRLFNRLDESHPQWGGPSALHGPPIQMLQMFLPETLSQTPPEIMFSQISGHPLAQSSSHIKVTVIMVQGNLFPSLQKSSYTIFPYFPDPKVLVIFVYVCVHVCVFKYKECISISLPAELKEARRFSC